MSDNNPFEDILERIRKREATSEDLKKCKKCGISSIHFTNNISLCSTCFFEIKYPDKLAKLQSYQELREKNEDLNVTLEHYNEERAEQEQEENVDDNEYEMLREEVEELREENEGLKEENEGLKVALEEFK